jgi:hypothetical protein
MPTWRAFGTLFQPKGLGQPTSSNRGAFAVSETPSYAQSVRRFRFLFSSLPKRQRIRIHFRTHLRPRLHDTMKSTLTTLAMFALAFGGADAGFTKYSEMNPTGVVTVDQVSGACPVRRFPNRRSSQTRQSRSRLSRPSRPSP